MMEEKINIDTKKQENIPQPVKQFKKTKQENPTTNSKPIKRRLIPNRDYKVLLLARAVLMGWKKDPDFKLRRITIEEFEKIVDEYEKILKQKSANKAMRSPIVNKLKLLDKEIDKNLDIIKSMIKLKFGIEKYESYCSEFGLVKRGRYMGLPVNRGSRLFALNKIVESLKKYKMDNSIYGLDYWKNIAENYNNYLKENLSKAQNISSLVGKKNELKKQITKTLKNIKKQLEIDYGEINITTLRSYGFLYRE